MFASNTYTTSQFAIVNKKTNELLYSWDMYDEDDNEVPWYAMTAPLEMEYHLCFTTEEDAWIYFNTYELSHSEWNVVQIHKRIYFEGV